jgi:type II secretory ATPase GspE/PulE/Tfp pilus assembly ATPase PilB-like protein
VQAALTGHLVLSTIHTNNAAGVIPRLIDMGVDPFLIAPTLILAIAQRLVKTLCPGGGRAIKVEGALRTKIEAELAEIPEEFRDQIPVGDNVYEAEITPDCPKGTSGRAAVIEVISMSKELEQIILKNPVEQEIVKAARKQGMLTLREDAMIKAFKRQIPFEEVVRL